MNSNIVLVGIQWGDEGKAKIIDHLAETADIVVRFQGGNNAGHTIVVGNEKTVLHLIPSGILHKNVVNVVGNGVVFDMAVFLQEKERLQAKGVDVSPARLKVSEICHVIFPYHQLLDRSREKSREIADIKIGTTGRGIGPAYGDKAMRIGIRLGLFRYPEVLRKSLESAYHEKSLQLKEFGNHDLPPFEEVLDISRELFSKIEPHLVDTSRFLSEQSKRGKKILFEGAQGTLLDIDYGTYPFVTSSNTTSGFAACGSGMGPAALQTVLGLTKAYTTRVGSGPFPTECIGSDEAVGKTIAQRGNEVGSTTGRARRCGWLDLVALKRAIELNSVQSLALSKLDVLSGLETVKVATHYRIDGQAAPTQDFPNFWLSPLEAVYEELPGWEPFPGTSKDSDLPKAAQSFIKRIEAYTQVPVGMISTGPDREQMIIRDKKFIA